MLDVGQIDSSTLGFGQLMAQTSKAGDADSWGQQWAAFCYIVSVCRRRACGIWMLGAGPELGGELLEGGGAPEPLQLPVPSCNPSLGSEFLLPSTHPFLSGH